MRRRSTRLSSVALPNPQIPTVSFSTRFSLPSFVKQVEKLTDEQQEAIKKTGFGNLLYIPNQTLSKNLLAELMDRWDYEKQAFVLNPGPIRITLKDIALILGLRVVGNSIYLKEDEPFSDIEKEYGVDISKRNITVASLERRLSSFGGIANDDFVRTFLLFTFGTFLFPSTTGKVVDSRYLTFLSKLDDICHFSWGEAVLNDILKSLNQRKEENVQYVGGCLFCLQIWAYEHIHIARPTQLENCLTVPRACRWENSKPHQRQWFTTRFDELQDHQIDWELQLSTEETNLDIIKELLEAKMGIECQRSKDIPESIALTFENDNLEIRNPVMDNQLVEEEKTEVETSTVRRKQLLQDVNLEQLKATPDIKEVLMDSTDHPTPSCCMQNVNEEHEKLALTSKDISPHFTEEDLRATDQTLDRHIMAMKKEIDDLKRENELLRSQLSSSPRVEEQNIELKKEVDELRREIQELRISSNTLERIERIFLEEDINGAKGL